MAIRPDFGRSDPGRSVCFVIVVDASAAVEWLLGRDGSAAIAAQMADPEVPVHAPDLLGVEILAALRGLVMGRHTTRERAEVALSDFNRADIALHDPTPVLPRAWELRDNLTAHDAVYVALAELLDATLITTDARLAKAPGLPARVMLIST